MRQVHPSYKNLNETKFLNDDDFIIRLLYKHSVTGVSRSFFHNVTFYAHIEEPIRVRHTWRAQTVTSTFPVTWPVLVLTSVLITREFHMTAACLLLVIQSLACTEARRIECANVIGKE